MDYPPPDPPPLNFTSNPTDDSTLRSLLRNLTSPEPTLYTLGCKDFSTHLKSHPTFLSFYLTSSPHLTELLQAWSRWRGSHLIRPLFNLITLILSLPLPLPDPTAKAQLDKFARVILEERFEDVSKEVRCKDGRREKAGLLLIAAIVRRGSLLAADVARAVDFKTVAGRQWRNNVNKSNYKGVGDFRGKSVTRDAFVEFAMSFVEVAKPGLLRAVLKNKDVYGKVMMGLGDDKEETVVYVLSTVRDRVLFRRDGEDGNNVLSPGMRSVLFGSLTLENLAVVSGRGGVAGRVAFEVLERVCLEPENGLMPDLGMGLKGNVKRVVGVMRKMKAVEVARHRDLLLRIVKGRAAFGSGFLEEFPYNLEDNAAPVW